MYSDSCVQSAFITDLYYRPVLDAFYLFEIPTNYTLKGYNTLSREFEILKDENHKEIIYRCQLSSARELTGNSKRYFGCTWIDWEIDWIVFTEYTQEINQKFSDQIRAVWQAVEVINWREG